MSTTNISAADKTILDLLAKDATLTHAQLAAMVGCAEAEVTERIRVLESLGVIKGYQAIIDWEKVDENKATALIQLKVVPEPDQGFDKLAHRIMQFEEVEGVYLMSGGYDLTVVLQGKSMRDIALFVARRPGTESYLIDLRDGRLLQTITSNANRHFYGHAVIHKSGDWLYATENDTSDPGRGLLGVYKFEGERLVHSGEISTHGIGPHQVSWMPDGETLVVANGGIRTEAESRVDMKDRKSVV